MLNQLYKYCTSTRMYGISTEHSVPTKLYAVYITIKKLTLYKTKLISQTISELTVTSVTKKSTMWSVYCAMLSELRKSSFLLYKIEQNLTAGRYIYVCIETVQPKFRDPRWKIVASATLESRVSKNCLFSEKKSFAAPSGRQFSSRVVCTMPKHICT